MTSTGHREKVKTLNCPGTGDPSRNRDMCRSKSRDQRGETMKSDRELNRYFELQLGRDSGSTTIIRIVYVACIALTRRVGGLSQVKYSVG